VVSDEADPLLESFDGRRVDVVGEPLEPEGHALVAPHLQVRTLRLVNADPGARNVAIGAEVHLTGWFEEWTWPAGTKLAGEKTLRFVAVDGRSFFVAPLPAQPPLGEPVTVRARAVEPSPFLGGVPGGDHLWVYEVRERD
jgi:hypothetical protein